MKRMDVNIRAVDLQLLILSCIKVQKASFRKKKLKTPKLICKSKCIQARPELRRTEMRSNIFNESNIQKISTNIHDGPIF